MDDLNDMFYSILVPVYNSSAHLADCVQSVLAQTDKRFELILVDDGSTDGSSGICDQFRQKDPRVRVIHKSNQGSLLARRDALDHAKGSYIAFLDSDDILLPTFLEESTRIIESNNPDIVAFDFFSDEDEDSRFLYKPPTGMYAGHDYQTIRELTCTGLFHNLWGRVFKRSVIDYDADYRPFTGMTYTEDWFLVLAFVNNASSFFYSPHKLYHYRDNEGSTQHAYKPAYVQYLFFTLDRLNRLATQWGGACPANAKRTFLTHCAALISRIQDSCKTPEEAFAEQQRLATYIFPERSQFVHPSNMLERYYAFPLKCLERNHTRPLSLWLKLHSLLKRLI